MKLFHVVCCCGWQEQTWIDIFLKNWANFSKFKFSATDLWAGCLTVKKIFLMNVSGVWLSLQGWVIFKLLYMQDKAKPLFCSPRANMPSAGVSLSFSSSPSWSRAGPGKERTFLCITRLLPKTDVFKSCPIRCIVALRASTSCQLQDFFVYFRKGKIYYSTQLIMKCPH